MDGKPFLHLIRAVVLTLFLRDIVKMLVMDERGTIIPGASYLSYCSTAEAKGRFIEACKLRLIMALNGDPSVRAKMEIEA
jgi:hypothetical protein